MGIRSGQLRLTGFVAFPRRIHKKLTLTSGMKVQFSCLFQLQQNSFSGLIAVANLFEPSVDGKVAVSRVLPIFLNAYIF